MVHLSLLLGFDDAYEDVDGRLAVIFYMAVTVWCRIGKLHRAKKWVQYTEQGL